MKKKVLFILCFVGILGSSKSYASCLELKNEVLPEAKKMLTRVEDSKYQRPSERSRAAMALRFSVKGAERIVKQFEDQGGPNASNVAALDNECQQLIEKIEKNIELVGKATPVSTLREMTSKKVQEHAIDSALTHFPETVREDLHISKDYLKKEEK